MEAIGALSGILTVIGVVTKLGKSLNEVKDRYSNVSLNTTLAASQLNTIGAALRALYEWRLKDKDQTAPAQQLDKDLGVSLSCCSILISVIEGKLGESGYSPGLKDKIRYVWLEDIMKEYVSALESQVRALQLLLTIYQCASQAEQRQRLARADSRKIIEDVRAETASLGLESQDLVDRASIYSNPSVEFDVDSIIMKSPIYQKVYGNVHHRKPVPESLNPSDIPRKGKPPVPPRNVTQPLPPIPPRLPPRRKTEVNNEEEGRNSDEMDKTSEKKDTEPDSSNEPLPLSQEPEETTQHDDAEKVKDKADIDREPIPQDEAHENEAGTSALPTTDLVKQDLPDSRHVERGDVAIPEIKYPDEENREPTTQIPIQPPNEQIIRCICGFDFNDGKIVECRNCTFYQHAECYYRDEFGIVPTKSDLRTIVHWCCGCAPRTLRVEEAIERKRKQLAEMKVEESKKKTSPETQSQAESIILHQKEPASEPQIEIEKTEKQASFEVPHQEEPASEPQIKVDKPKNEASFEAQLQSESVILHQKEPPEPQDSDNTAIDDLRNEMRKAFGDAPDLTQPTDITNLREPSIDLKLDSFRPEKQEDTVLPVDKAPIDEGTNESREEEKLESLSTREPTDAQTDEAVVEPTASNLSAKSVRDNESTTDLPAPSVKSIHDDHEEPTQEESTAEPLTTSRLTPILTTKSQDSKTDDDSNHSDHAKVPGTDSNLNSTGEGEGLDLLISKIKLSRMVETSAGDMRPQPEDIRTPPLALDSGSAGSPIGRLAKLDTTHGRESFESRSTTFSGLPSPRHPPPPPPTQQNRTSGVVESVTSTESSERASSLFEAASTVSSDFPEVDTTKSVPTAATSLMPSMQTTRTRAQSDLRRLQHELTVAKDRGDSKAKEDSIQRSIDVIWATYLSPPEDPTSPQKAHSPHLGSRASFLRLPSFSSSSSKSRIALANAVSKDDATAIRKLLDEKANVNARADNDETPLMLAASLGHLTSMKLLKEYGADERASDGKGRTALHLAVAYNQTEIVKYLLEAYPTAPKTPAERTSKMIRAKDLARGSRSQKNLREMGDTEGSTPLMVATDRGSLGVVNMLLAAGVEIEAKDHLGRTPLFRAVISGKKACFETLISRGANIHAVDAKHLSLLHLAAANDQVEMIKVLLAKGIDKGAVDHEGFQAIHHAAKYGRISAITGLITSNSDLETPTKSGERVLHIATAHNHLALVEHLITCNVDVNPWATPVPATLKGMRPVGTQLIPLHYSCQLGLLEMSILLLKHLALVNAPTNTGFTALMLAADIENTNLINVLLESGAKVNASVPGTLLTALHISARKGDLESVQQLCRGGANDSARTSGSYGRNAIEEATRFADPAKAILVVEYLKLLRDNRMRAKRQNNAGRAASTSSLYVRPGPGAPMTIPTNGVPPNGIIQTQGFDQAGVPWNAYMQSLGQGAPPNYALPMQPQQYQQMPYQQYQHPQQPQPQQYFNPQGYQPGYEQLPAYQPGPNAPNRLANQPGVYRPNQ